MQNVQAAKQIKVWININNPKAIEIPIITF